MINTERTKKGAMYKTRKIYSPDIVQDASAVKKETIVTEILDEADQLNLLAVLVEQIGDSIGLATPEFIQAKVEFDKIRKVLGVTV